MTYVSDTEDEAIRSAIKVDLDKRSIKVREGLLQGLRSADKDLNYLQAEVIDCLRDFRDQLVDEVKLQAPEQFDDVQTATFLEFARHERRVSLKALEEFNDSQVHASFARSALLPLLGRIVKERALLRAFAERNEFEAKDLKLSDPSTGLSSLPKAARDFAIGLFGQNLESPNLEVDFEALQQTGNRSRDAYVDFRLLVLAAAAPLEADTSFHCDSPETPAEAQQFRLAQIHWKEFEKVTTNLRNTLRESVDQEALEVQAEFLFVISDGHPMLQRAADVPTRLLLDVFMHAGNGVNEQLDIQHDMSWDSIVALADKSFKLAVSAERQNWVSAMRTSSPIEISNALRSTIELAGSGLEP